MSPLRLCERHMWKIPSFLPFCSCSRFLKKFQKLKGENDEDEDEDDFRLFQHLQENLHLPSFLRLFNLLLSLVAVAAAAL